VDGELIAIPRNRRPMKFDGIMIVARRAVGQIDLERSVLQRGLGVPDLDRRRLAQDIFRVRALAFAASNEVTAGAPA
jgi:hypothetical protein